jgi:hypothetical protein
MLRKQKDKHLPPVELEAQPSRRQRGHSFGNLISHIWPSRRPERGFTLRNEFKDDGPLSAVDLVFGITEPQKAAHVEDSKNIEAAKGSPHHFAPAQSLKPVAYKEHGQGVRKETSKVVERAGEDDKGKKLGLKTPLSSKSNPEHGDSRRPPASIASQLQQPSFRMSSLNFGNDTLGLHFQIPPTAKNKDGEGSDTQQIYEAKKARREQRRSLMESGDFLGVQGANPRTGYWDMSNGTTSSDPSQLSSGTRKKLEQQAKEVEEHGRNYAQAQAEYNAGLERAQTLRAKRHAEKMDEKLWQIRLMQRRRGRWNAGENGWSSVAEPDLSPVMQSVVGSPVKG